MNMLSNADHENTDQSDFIVVNGHAGISHRCAANLLKVSQTAVSNLIKSEKLFDCKEAESIAEYGIRGENLVKLAKHFAKSKQTPSEAKEHCIDLLEKSAIIGVQTFIDRLAGITEQELPPASPPKFTELPIAAVEISSQILKNAGVNVALVSSFQLDQYGKADSIHRHIYQDAKALLSSQYVIPELPMSPTELGKKIAERLGLAKPLSAQKVNQALIECGLQTSESITKNRGGKIKTEIVYHLTEAGEEFGEILMTTAPQNGKTVFPLRWFGPVVDQLVQLTSLQEVKS